MECTLFPKFFRELSLNDLGRTLRDLGFDGTDIMVRDGYWVTAETLENTLPQFVRAMHDFGLSTENAVTDYLEPNDSHLESAVACLAENGVRQFRLRGFAYRGNGTFHPDFEQARFTLERFEKLGEKYGIRAFLQTHGGMLHSSAAASFALVNGFDPAYVAIHHDPGNMICQEGYETWEKGFDILGDYLCMVGVKNAAVFHVPSGTDYRLKWRREWTTLEEGEVDWRAVLKALSRRRFSGPLCMHNFYERGMDGLIEQTRRDLNFLRKLLSDMG